MALLLVVSLSRSSAETSTPLESVSPAALGAMVPTTSIATVPSAGARAGSRQPRLSAGVAGRMQVTPGPVALVTWKPAGRRSRTMTSWATPGPALLSDRRKRAAPPTATVGVRAVLATLTSTVLGTLIVALVVRVNGVGSGVGEVTVAVLTSVASFAVTVASTGITTLDPGLRLPMSQWTAAVQVTGEPSGSTGVTSVKDAGSIGSSRVTASAVEGPSLVTTIVYVTRPPEGTTSASGVLLTRRSDTAAVPPRRCPCRCPGCCPRRRSRRRR